MKFGILLGNCGTAVGAGLDLNRLGVENDMADDVKGGDRRLGETKPPAKGGLIGDRGTGLDGMKSVPSLPLAALTAVRLLVDVERFRQGIAPPGAVLGRNEDVFDLGNSITGRAAICACREPEKVKALVDGDFLNAVAFAGGLCGCFGCFIVKGAEDSSLVAMLSKD